MNYKKILVFLLSIIGISVVACYKYAAIVSSFELKGKVTDTLDNPIENLQITLQENGHLVEKTTTDETGNYYFLDGGFTDNTTVMVKVEDVDGEENGGEFATQIITFPIKNSDYVKGKKGKRDKDYKGSASKEIDFKLIKKQ